MFSLHNDRLSHLPRIFLNATIASMLALFRKAYRDLTKRRVRSFLTIGAIAIGVAGIVAIISTAQNLTRAQAAAYQNASQADATYWVWDAPPATLRAIAEIPNVSAAELRATYFSRCKWNGEFRDVYLIGLENFSDNPINHISLLDRAPRANEFVAEASVRNLFANQAGDVVACRAGDGTMRSLTLVGYATSPNYISATILDYATVYVNASDVRALLGTSGSNQLLLKFHDLAKARETTQDVSRLLNRRGVQNASPTIRDPLNYPGKRELDALFVLLTVFSSVGLVASGFLVANTLAAMTAEQVGEIGTLKAIGGTRWQVLTVYFFASLMYGVVGTMVGIALGALASWRLFDYIGGLFNLQQNFAIAPEGFALGVAVGIGVTVLAGLIPSFIATRIRVKDALEAYGITSTYGRGWVDQILQRMIALPPLAAMSLRNLARRKARSIITTLVIAVAVAGWLAAQSTSASVDVAIDGLFQTFRVDAWAWLDTWVGSNFVARFRSAEGVRAAEVWTLTDAWVDASRVRVWGVPTNTVLYAPRLVDGRWFGADEWDAVVISTDLAQERHFQVGDIIDVEIGGTRRPFRIVGITIDNSIFLGSTVAGKVFVSESMVERMENRQGWAAFFALAFDSSDPAIVDKRLGELSERFKQYRMGSGSSYREVKGAKEQSRILSIALYAMSLLIGAMGALGVVNTLTLNVLERRREIGVLRAIGAMDASLVQTFLTEGIAIGIVGWLVGLLVGYPLGRLLLNLMQAVLFHIDYIFSPGMIASSFVFALVLAILASLAPALGAARLRVGQVLRYE